MADCPHGLDDRWCSTCLHGPKPKVEQVTVEARFGAHYEGQCWECDLPILVGQRIAKLSNDRYVHSPLCEP